MSDPVDAAHRRTVERLALAQWPGSAAARTVSVTIVGDRAEVALQANGDYGYWVYFERDEPGWRETVSGNGATVGWHDQHPWTHDD